MKRMKLWITIILAIAASGILIVLAIEEFKVALVEPSQVENPQLLQPPENATVIPELEPISFHLHLETREITLSKEQSINIAVTIYSLDRVDLLLIARTEDYVPGLALIGPLPELPKGIVAYFNHTQISVGQSSTVAVNLTLSIGNEAASGTYKLLISAIQSTFHGGVVASVPLMLVIP